MPGLKPGYSDYKLEVVFLKEVKKKKQEYFTNYIGIFNLFNCYSNCSNLSELPRDDDGSRKAIDCEQYYFETEYGDIEYTVEGEGKPVLLLHGAGGGYDQGLWVGKVFFGDDYKFISVSRYGYLRSSIPDNASIELQATAYKNLLDNLSIDKVIVVGASAGGPSATQFANDYPDRCSALILISAVSMGPAPGDQDPFYVSIIHIIQQSDYVYWLFTRFFFNLQF